MDKPTAHGNHICTTTVPHDELDKLCSMGLNFRPNPDRGRKHPTADDDVDPKTDFVEQICSIFAAAGNNLKAHFPSDNQGDFGDWSSHIQSSIRNLYSSVNFDAFKDHCTMEDRKLPYMTECLESDL
jgi:hypothetical protein